MCGSGATIGMVVTVLHHRRIPRVRLRARTVCFVVAVGTTMRMVLVLPVVATILRALAVATWVCELVCHQVNSEQGRDVRSLDGSWNNNANNYRVANRNNNIGFRACLPSVHRDKWMFAP